MQTLAKGKVLSINEVDNYIDDPKAIDRRYEAKTSDILLKALQKVKWKEECECGDGEEYTFTIGEKGTVVKVSMPDYKTEKEIEENWEMKEYNYCINTVMKALRALRFDIIKDKGKPIPENVYLEIWINEDGKLENWTN